MNYATIAKPYKPKCIKILLIGEAPPHNGTSYFYKIPAKYPLMDTSMPFTIFNHYFNKCPNDKIQYKDFLECLKSREVFLIDIINKPLEIRKNRKFNFPNIAKLTCSNTFKNLKQRIKRLSNCDTKIIFLLPTGRPYIKKLQKVFPNASFVNWKCFRLDIHEAEECKKKTSP